MFSWYPNHSFCFMRQRARSQGGFEGKDTRFLLSPRRDFRNIVFLLFRPASQGWWAVARWHATAWRYQFRPSPIAGKNDDLSDLSLRTYIHVLAVDLVTHPSQQLFVPTGNCEVKYDSPSSLPHARGLGRGSHQTSSGCGCSCSWPRPAQSLIPDSSPLLLRSGCA